MERPSRGAFTVSRAMSASACATPTVPAETGAPDLASVWRTLVEDLPPSQRAWLTASRPVTLHEHTAIIAVAALVVAPATTAVCGRARRPSADRRRPSVAGGSALR